MNRLQKIMIILSLLLFTGGGTVLAFKLRTKPLANNQSTQQQTSTAVQAQPITKSQQPTSGSSTNKSTSTNSQPKPPATSPSSSTNTDYNPPPTGPTCPDYLKNSYTEVYNANINAENINYQSNKQSISEYWSSRGLLYSGMHQAALAAEDQRHQAALTNIESSYQQQLASSHCS